MVIQWCIFFII